MKKWIYVTIPLLLALILRLYPSFISGLPFSTDAWSPIRNAELLMEYTPTHIGDDKVFDGYNNYWPANSLFGAVFSVVTGLEPKQGMTRILPVIGSMAILIFYALVKRLYNAKISFMASIIFATAFSHAFFTAAVTKETYANPLYLLLLLIFLHPTIDRRKQALLFTITSIALTLTHHLTPLIAMALLFSIALARLINNTRKSLAPNKFDFLLTSILITTFTLYYLFYAHTGFKIPLTLSDWLSVASYQILAFALAIYLIFKPYVHISAKTIVISLGAIAIAFLFTILTTIIPLLPGFPTLPRYYLLYNFPYVIAIPLIILGYRYHRRSTASIAPMFWLTSLIGLEAYAIFSNSTLSLPLYIRTLNFLHPPLAILAAAGLYRMYGTTEKPHLGNLMKSAAIAAILIIASLNCYSLYSAISLEERYMGYHWLYKTQEYKAGTWIAATTSSLTIAGDMKVAYLMRDYFHAEADVLQGYRYLAEERESQPQILFIYSQMFKNGYVVGYHGVDLPQNWMEKASELNLVYSNGLASLYAGENT